MIDALRVPSSNPETTLCVSSSCLHPTDAEPDAQNRRDSPTAREVNDGGVVPTRECGCLLTGVLRQNKEG